MQSGQSALQKAPSGPLDLPSACPEGPALRLYRHVSHTCISGNRTWARFVTVLKQHPDHPSGGKTFVIRRGGRGSGPTPKQTAFPRPAKDHGRLRSLRTGATTASARRCQGDSVVDVARAVAFAMEAESADRGLNFRPCGREKETHCVSPPARDRALQTGRSGNNDRSAPGPAGAKRLPWAGRALGFSAALWQERWPLPVAR